MDVLVYPSKPVNFTLLTSFVTISLLVLLFLVSAVLVGYTFLGYPLLIARYAGPERTRDRQAHDFAVTVVIAAYNAGKHIEARLDNLLSQNYPSDRLQIIVVDDGSSDDTWEKLNRWADHPAVTLIAQPENGGKARALNVGLAAAKSELVVLTDVRQTFEPNTIAELVDHFTDPGVGAVTGNLVFAQGDEPDPQGGYWDLEKSIRENESRYRSTVGVTGAVYAARRELIDTLPDSLILDDVLIPMRIVRAGYRVKFETAAVAYDTKSDSLLEEYYRKVRTLAGNWQLLAQAPWLLSRTENPIFFEFISHKVLRLLAPWALVAMLVCAFLLRENGFFMLVFVGQVSLIALAAVGFVGYWLRFKVPLAGALMGFALLNVAAIVGTFKFFMGRQKDLWRTH